MQSDYALDSLCARSSDIVFHGGISTWMISCSNLVVGLGGHSVDYGLVKVVHGQMSKSILFWVCKEVMHCKV